MSSKELSSYVIEMGCRADTFPAFVLGHDPTRSQQGLCFFDSDCMLMGIEEELNVTNHSKIRADDWA